MGMITDPWFYALAAPAVLMMGMSKSGFGAGFGALAVPLMSLVVPVPQAAAIMLPLLAVMDGFGFTALVKYADTGLLKLLLPAGLLGTLLGTALFSVLSAATVAVVVGVLTLLFVAQRLLWSPRPDAAPPTRWLGFLLGIASGFTSFVSHAGSPPITAYVLPLQLSPLRFSATLAVFFTAINLSKWIPYAWLGLIDLGNLGTSLLLMPLAPLGVWCGLKLMRRVSQRLFYRLVTVGMALTGVVLVWKGLG